MTSRLGNRFNIFENDDDGSYLPPSLRKNEETKKIEKKEETKVIDFPSLISIGNELNSSNNSVWGNNIKLSVIKDELRVSPVLTNRELLEDNGLIECYYEDCCKYMNKSIAKLHNKYGVNYYDRTKDKYYYTDSYYGHLAFSSPSKFKQLIDEIEANGEEPYFVDE
jgi:hypothetical protein